MLHIWPDKKQNSSQGSLGEKRDMDKQTQSGNFSSKVLPYLLMVGMQFGLAGTYIVIKETLDRGMNRYVLIVYRQAVAAIVLAPFALLLERKTRPKMTISVFLQIMALGFMEPVLDQGFGFLGMQYTSASFTSAVMNAVPAVTFIIAVILRMERVKLKEVRSQAKVIGTIITFGGALLMTLYKGPIVEFLTLNKTSHLTNGGTSSGQHWVIGTLFILLACFSWSGFYVLQTIVIKKYPAELTLTTLICFTGTLQTAAVAFVFEHHPKAWAVGWDHRLFAPLYTGVVSSGLTYYVQGYVMKTRGPVFVTAFNPLCMIIVTALGSLILAEKIYLGSVIGAIIIAIGLYSVVWGKSKDYTVQEEVHTTAKLGEALELPVTAKSEMKSVST